MFRDDEGSSEISIFRIRLESLKQHLIDAWNKARVFSSDTKENIRLHLDASRAEKERRKSEAETSESSAPNGTNFMSIDFTIPDDDIPTTKTETSGDPEEDIESTESEEQPAEDPDPDSDTEEEPEEEESEPMVEVSPDELDRLSRLVDEIEGMVDREASELHRLRNTLNELHDLPVVNRNFRFLSEANEDGRWVVPLEPHERKSPSPLAPVARWMGTSLGTVIYSTVVLSIAVLLSARYGGGDQQGIPNDVLIWSSMTIVWSYGVFWAYSSYLSVLNITPLIRLQTSIGVGLLVAMGMLIYDRDQVIIGNIWSITAGVIVILTLLGGVLRSLGDVISKKKPSDSGDDGT